MLMRFKLIMYSCLILGSGQLVYAAENSSLTQRTVAATGHAEVKIPQTIATMTFVISENDDQAKDAQLIVRQKANNLLDKIKAAHPLSVHTSDVSVAPVMSYKDGVSKVTGYSASYSVEVTTKISEAGKMIDLAIANNVENINSPRFSASNDERAKAQLEAIRLATLRAKLQANTSLSALGLKETGVKQITVTPFNYSPHEPRAMLMRTSAENSPQPTIIEAGDDTISADVNIVVGY